MQLTIASITEHSFCPKSRRLWLTHRMLPPAFLNQNRRSIQKGNARACLVCPLFKGCLYCGAQAGQKGFVAPHRTSSAFLPSAFSCLKAPVAVLTSCRARVEAVGCSSSSWHLRLCCEVQMTQYERKDQRDSSLPACSLLSSYTVKMT